MNNVLICTVGGSHQPILKAIQSTSPIYTVFVCSQPNAITKASGSDVQILGTGKVIATKGDAKLTLENIPTQAQLPTESYEVILIPDDDLEPGFAAISETLDALHTRFPGARIIANYTGGTKTMSAALVLAASERSWTYLEITTGSRTDLVKVIDGSEHVIAMPTTTLRIERQAQILLQYWKTFSYAQAHQGLDALLRSEPSIPTEHRTRLSRSIILSKAFDAWDRFRYDKALELLETLSPTLKGDIAPYLSTLHLILKGNNKGEILVLFDLWNNAQRRAEQNQWDDAVVRCYRLIEATAQWILKTHHEIDTSDIPPQRVPPTIDLSANSHGRIQAPLYKSWELIETLHNGPAKDFIRSQFSALRSHIEIRNKSFLGHGLAPISEKEWTEIRAWIQNAMIPMLQQEGQGIGLRIPPTQLPQSVPDAWIK